MFHCIDPKELKENVFSLIGDQWTLVTAGTEANCNTMTASWGGLGVLWNKNVATIYIRPQRYTKEYLEANDTFSLSFFTEEWRKALAYCGKVSGRDEDKFAHCGFDVALSGETPYIAQARLVLICKKLYWQDLDPENMGPEASIHYANKDYHRMYIAEITQVLVKD